MTVGRTRRWVLAAAPILAGHAGLLLILMMARPEPLAPYRPEPPFVTVELVKPPPAPPVRIIAPDPAPQPDAPAAAAQSPTPPRQAPRQAPKIRPPAVAAARPRPVVAKPPPEIEPLPVASAPPGPPLPLLGAAQLAGAATVGAGPGGGGGNGAGGGGAGGSGAGSGGGSCDMVRWVQDAVRDDAAVRRAVIAAAQDMQADGRAILVWNGDWLQSRNQSGKGLAGVRQAIALEVAFAPAECKTQRMTGLAVLDLEDRPGGARIALGRGSWRWSDLLGTG
ncbi:hypothetical protein [uncultured Brevundimonas sp.]|uniref:hypothetical protein n=1 Tax=uncultured Brevundimonas sp. TaxID=213418 RepID=UPI0026327208|nr:hypothetical protein [uncultured Brevundimonas sp.]